MRLLTLTSLLALLAITMPSLADDNAKPALPEDALKFSKPKAALYDKLFVFNEGDNTGAGMEVKSDKYRFLHLRAVINYKLPENSEAINLDGRDIKLVQDGGKVHPSVGSFDENKVFSSWAKGFWLHSSNRRRNEMLDIVYAIPADAKGPFALVIGDLKTLRIEMPKQATDPPHPADMVEVEVNSVAWGDSVPGEEIQIGDKEIETTFKVPGRRLLAVSVMVHAKEYNDSDGKSLHWTSQGLAIRDKKGNVFACHGGLFMKRLNQHVNHSSDVGKKSTDKKIFFFSPPDDIESFEVLWYGRPVTEYKIKP